MHTLDLLFSWFVVSTVRAALLSLAVLAMQSALTRRMPARWRYALWLPVIFVCVSPHLPESGWSVENRFAPQVTHAQRTEPFLALNVPMDNRSSLEHASSPVIQAPATHIDWRHAAALAWGAGAVGLCMVALAAYARTMRRIRRGAVGAAERVVAMLRETASAAGLRRPPTLLISTAVQSPAVTGFLRPVLLLPVNFSTAFTREEARIVLLHEMMHLKRHDLLLNWLLGALQAIHWCNPVLWFAFARIRADRESACDAEVLAVSAEDVRAEYGNALLRLQDRLGAPRLNLGFLGIFERSGGMHARMRAIAAYRPAHPAWGFVTLMLIAALSLVGATRAQERPGATTPQSTSTSAQIRQKLKTIIVPRLELREATVREALDFLVKKSVELDTAEPDPGQRGIDVVLIGPDAGSEVASNIPAPPAVNPAAARLTISLSNVPLMEAFKYVTELANLKFRIRKDAVEVVARNTPDPLVTKQWKVSSRMGFQRGSDPKELLLSSGISFPAGATAALSAEGTLLTLTNSEENIALLDEMIAAASERRDVSGDMRATTWRAGRDADLRAAQVIERKLNAIIIPKLEFREATVREAIEFLKRKSVELDTTEPDATKRGVNMVLNVGQPIPAIPGLEPLPEANRQDARITVSLNNVPLMEALKYVTSLANLRFRIDAHAISIDPASGATVLITKEFKLDEATLKALSGAPAREAKEVLTANGVDFPAGASARWNPLSKRLIVRNTQDNLDRVELLLLQVEKATPNDVPVPPPR